MFTLKNRSLVALLALAASCSMTNAQDKLYPNEFPISDVKLLDGPLKHAQDLNVKVLLQYDIDRLLAPFLKEAGLPPKAELYPNWAGLDGHVGGHYLTALALHAAQGDKECRDRMLYMISELKACAEAASRNFPEWGKGYIGGVPESGRIWSSLKKGEFGPYKGAWVPFYNVHKIFAGLRDAWLYCGNEDARKLFIGCCDWAIDITADLSDEQMEDILGTEHGGMNEVLADAYAMTKEQKYLDAAQRYSHKWLLNPMLNHQAQMLDNKHANTQVPKVVGFARVGELTQDESYLEASRYFWNEVTTNRSLSVGGNSRREHFPSAEACIDWTQDIDGLETCNTNNMLKLTEDLSRLSPDEARYADFFERATFNHLLSAVHPEHGGYVYFTSARPRHYRNYSVPNEAMWCCVGTGMENPGKYGQYIYTHAADSVLWINLYTASTLQWRQRGIQLKQETDFPYSEQSRFTISQGSGEFDLRLRYPGWVYEGQLEISINGEKQTVNAKPQSYVTLHRRWKKGDVIEVKFPMHNSIEHMPNVPQYISILHGPIALGMKTGTEDLAGLLADDSRFGQMATGRKLPIDQAPYLIASAVDSIVNDLEPISGEPLHFRLKTRMGNPIGNGTPIVQPFFEIHDSRYMLYWLALSTEGYREYIDKLKADEQARLALEDRTVDKVQPGEQQPESDHFMETDQSNTGYDNDIPFRDANNGHYFSYLLQTHGLTDLSLRIRYWGQDEWRTAEYDLYIDDQLVRSVNVSKKWRSSQWKYETYRLPASVLEGKQQVRVKFVAKPHRQVGQIYEVRLLKNDGPQDIMSYDKPASIWLEALPLGNSHLGAMVYGGIEKETIELNEETFWSGGPHNNDSKNALSHLQEARDLIFANHEKEAADLIDREFIIGPHGMKYLSAGKLDFEFKLGDGEVTDYQRSLDLSKAIATTSFRKGGVNYQREVFASMANNVIVIRLTTDQPGALKFQLGHDSELQTTNVTRKKGRVASIISTMNGVEHEGIPSALRAVMKANVTTNGRTDVDDSGHIIVSDASEAIVLVNIATNFVNYHDVSGFPENKVEVTLKKLGKMSYEQLQANHTKAYEEQYNRVNLRLGSGHVNSSLPTDQRLDRFYASTSTDSPDLGMVSLLFNYGRYLLISSSQGEDGQAANLQGIWNNKPDAPWDSKYTININAEMNYWPAEICNLSETNGPLFSMIRDLSVTGAKTARTMYDCRGWMAHHNTDIWRIAGPVDGAAWGMFPNGGAWLTTHLWEHYKYTLDKEWLKAWYPIIRGAADFLIDYMQPIPANSALGRNIGPNNYLVTVPSVSPEHGGVGKETPVGAGCTMDNQIARDALTQALLASQVLGINTAYQDTLRQILSRIPPMAIGQYGQLQEWIEDLDDPKDEHRHISHLYGLYPSQQISPFTTPELWRASAVTLQQRGDQATGWSLGWKINFWARMLDGNHAFRIITNMLRLLPNEDFASMRAFPDGRTFPNLFDAHPPFQIDGNFGATAGIAEMLLQSELNFDAQEATPVVHLLPALPEAWNEGSICGLKARGNLTVDINWQDGHVTTATLLPAVSGVVRIRTNTPLQGLQVVKQYTDLQVFEYEINAIAGQQITLRSL